MVFSSLKEIHQKDPPKRSTRGYPSWINPPSISAAPAISLGEFPPPSHQSCSRRTPPEPDNKGDRLTKKSGGNPTGWGPPVMCLWVYKP